MMKLSMKSFAALVALILCPASLCAAVGVTRLCVEYADHPLGIDVAQPRFSWQLTAGGERNVRQQAYQITVTDETGREVWNTGRIADSRSLNVKYAGAPLQAATRYTWNVQTWDNKGGKSADSSWFETGLMADKESDDAWAGAQWIGGDASSRAFYSQYFPVFRLSCELRLDAKSKSNKAAFIYGANDLRLMDRNKNILNVENAKDQSFIKVELAVTDSARINIYRVGYTATDRADKPFASFTIPQRIIPRTMVYGLHRIEIASVTGDTQVSFDGEKIGHALLGPMGNNGDFIAFPVVGDIGFCMEKGQKAEFGAFNICNYRAPRALLSANGHCTVSGETRIFTPHETGTTLLRTSFESAHGQVKSARLYATALGVYDVFINGKRISDDYLNPGLTQYNKTLFYQTYDVTDKISEGSNLLTAQLNEGWWSGWLSYDASNWNYFGDRQALLAKLVVTYADGSRQTVVTRPQQWQFTTGGAVRYASIFQGEVYDARQEAVADTAWKPAEALSIDDVRAVRNDKEDTGTLGAWPAANDWSSHRLVAQIGDPVRQNQTLRARSMNEVRRGVYVYDMGQNMPGVPRIVFRGLKAGQRVLIRLAEVKYPDLPAYKGNEGMVMMENIRAAMAQDIYVAKGGGEETYQPRYTYHGFQFVEITGIDAPVATADVQGIVLSTIDRFTADYHSSDTTLNRFFENVKWSSLANCFSVPTDCPQRNERMGWSGDLSVFSPAMSYLFRGAQFMNRHQQALRDTQSPDGTFAAIAPVGGGFGGPLWQSVGIVMPWQSYMQYGDIDALRAHYPAMKNYMEMVGAKYIDPATHYYRGTATWSDLGDWLGFEVMKNDNTLIFDAYYAYELELMTKMARALGYADDAKIYDRRRQERILFINRNNIDAATGKTVGSGLSASLDRVWTGYIGTFARGKAIDTQTSYAVTLGLGVVSDANKARTVGCLLNSVTRQNTGDDGKSYAPYSLMTGFVGTPWILPALSDNGHTAEAYRMLLSHAYPSWLYPVDQGATTIWERLNSMTREDGFGGNNHMNSFNHYAFGSVTAWLMQRSLGIARDEKEPGFRHFILRPEADPTGQLTSASGYYESMYGCIESGWASARDGSATYRFTVPANTSATCYLPARRQKDVRVNGTSLAKAKYLSVKSFANGRAVMELTSGTYEFKVSGK